MSDGIISELACIHRHFSDILLATRYSVISEKPVHWPNSGIIVTKDVMLKELCLCKFMEGVGALRTSVAVVFKLCFIEPCSSVYLLQFFHSKAAKTQFKLSGEIQV